MSYGYFEDFLHFDHPVPWTVNGRHAEQDLRDIPQTQIGVFLQGKSVRVLNENDFADLVAQGLSETLNSRNADRLGLPTAVVDEAAEAVQQSAPTGEGSVVLKQS